MREIYFQKPAVLEILPITLWVKFYVAAHLTFHLSRYSNLWFVVTNSP